MNRLHIDSVTKTYRDKSVLHDIYLACHTGEIVAMLGRNGAGKSTLLKIIFGSEKADSKFVRVGKKRIRNIADGRGLINYLPQENFLPRGIRIRKLIDLFLPDQQSASIRENPFIIPLLKQKSGELSSGQRRVVEILLLIHSRAEFILLDEPFNGLSPKMRTYVSQCIRQCKEEKAFIITDHDHWNVLELADRLVFLKNGYLREITDKNQLIADGYLPDTEH
jgi:ABC-type multidrug transport system ATPase subunit